MAAAHDRLRLGLPQDTPAKVVVDKGKALGLVMSEKYVYTIRSNAKAKANRGAKKAAPATPAAVVLAPALSRAAGRPGATAEQVLYAAAAHLGLGRAIELLQAQHSILRSLLGE